MLSLSFAGLENSKQLSFCRVKRDTAIVLLLKLRGGADLPSPNYESEDNEDERLSIKDIQDLDRSGETRRPSGSLQMICTTQSCNILGRKKSRDILRMCHHLFLSYFYSIFGGFIHYFCGKWKRYIPILLLNDYLNVCFFLILIISYWLSGSIYCLYSDQEM